MIRLATAHSKLRHSRKIERADVDVAQQLMLRIIDQSRTIEGAAEEAGGQEGAEELEDDFDAQPGAAQDGPATRASGKAAGSRCALPCLAILCARSLKIPC